MTCEAPDCTGQDGVACWYDNGRWSLAIVACLKCRVRLQRLDLLTVDRREDLPCLA